MFHVKVPRLEPLLLAASVAAALLYLGGWGGGFLHVVLKPIPVLLLAGWVRARGRATLGPILVVGLVLSAAGDLLLEVERFVPGLVCFLTAHVAYLAGFLADERRPRLPRLLPFAAWSGSVFALLRPGLGTMELPVGAYIAVITLMMWRAAARVGSLALPPLAARIGLAGAIAFGASDTLVAIARFRQPIAGSELAIMLLYWSGQWGIAASSVIRPEKG
jgi:alkenylglycerophosphocholine/alkenylglycerophosphoethanolamine hydrolase